MVAKQTLRHSHIGGNLYAFLNSEGNPCGPVIKTEDGSLMDTLATQLTPSFDDWESMFVEAMNLSLKGDMAIQVVGVLKPFVSEN